MTYGELVRQERKRAGLTQQELADKVNVSKMTIRRIEAISSDEEIKSIRLETLIAISDAFKSYALWSMAVGGYGLSMNDPDADPENGLAYLTLNKLQREYGFTPEQIHRKVMMDYSFAELNDAGQQKVFDYIADLLGNPKYTEPGEEDKNGER